MSAVGRAGYKIADAVKALGVDFREKTVLDIGSSTGGFTEFALKKGATHVIAVEKGTNQMKAPLRFDERVELYEKMDIFDFHCMPPDIILADVSFVSLRKVLRYAAKELADEHTEYLVMLKPQFEARFGQLDDGVVKNNRIRRAIIADFEYWLKRNGFVVKGKRDNELAGRYGNVERFYYLKGAELKERARR
ncbi:TlyA family rRNA (cytidine-2'-O)-methyltransferase [Candidatus Saccharibacteria bacterium]|jgi:23S rRNA (cytidine1920-2'-O)/16S rRNA (cytidine1409-2'-O)-methyltransferase|nr:TlyA family rRNA (cytidine-2'-O)-methyltransferase [Candidatus Saccharibacteria bacterium]